MSETKSGLIAINIAALIFGTAALFGKLDVSPFWIVAMRGLFAAVTLFIICHVGGKAIRLHGAASIKMLLLSGIFLMLHWVSFFVSVQLSGIAIATLTFAAFPLFTVLVGAWIQRQWPSLLQIIAGVVIVVAVALLVDLNEAGTVFYGALAGLSSALLYAFFSIQSKDLIQRFPPLHVSFAQNSVVFLTLLPLLPFVSPMPALVTDWLWLAVLGVVSTALMLQLFLFALARLSPAVCSGFVALEPVYAVAFAAVFFDETLTIWVLVSGGLILGASLALLIADNRDKRRRAAHT